MFIEKLEIVDKNNSIIRNVEFEKGLNLIVDNTDKHDKNKSGNSIGKTTVLKVIDLCLGASNPNIIYKEENTNNIDQQLKSVIFDNLYTARLTVYVGSRKTVFTRALYTPNYYIINDIEYNGKTGADGFKQDAKEIIFGLKGKDPTFRDLMPKFIRIGKGADNIFKFQHGNCTDSKYQLIFSNLFHLINEKTSDDMSSRMKINKDLELNRRVIKRLNPNFKTIEILRQQIIQYEDLLKTEYEKRQRMDFIKEYKDEYDLKASLNSQKKQVESNIDAVESEITMINESLRSLRERKTEIDEEALRSIYNETVEIFDKINKSFSNLQKYHNDMIDDRIDYIKNILAQKTQYLDCAYSEQDRILEKMKDINISLEEENAFSELEPLNRKIKNLESELHEKKYAYEKLVSIEEELKENTEQIETMKRQYKESAEKVMVEVTRLFNNYSSELYEGINYTLAFTFNGFPIRYEKTSTSNNSPTKNKGISLGFDFAYIDYMEQHNYLGPRFIILDNIENLHINQIHNFFKLAQNENRQVIVSVLQERVENSEINISKNIRLQLSEYNKFFKV